MSAITDAALAEIERLAKAATDGPWVWHDGCSWRRLSSTADPRAPDGNVICPIVARDGHPDLVVSMENRAYIAAADPPTILALLAALAAERTRAERAEAERDRLREAAQAVIGAKFSTYRARNGRDVGIEDTSGEMCWIVPFDEMDELGRALGGQP